MNDAILPLDLYVVINNSNIDNQDREILIKLYQPIIGADAINFYFTLWGELDEMKVISIEESHYSLITKTKKDLPDLVKSRKLLEAVGLLKTYINEEKEKTYIYILYAPLNPDEFINHPILSVMLYSNLGQKLYNKTVDYFKIPKLDLSKCSDITSSFSDVFEVVPNINYDILLQDLRGKNKNAIIVNEEVIDFNMLNATLNLSARALNNDIKELINKLAYIYKINTEKMEDLVMQSVDDRGMVNKNKLRKLCSSYYRLENNGVLPNVIYKNQPEAYKSKLNSSSNKSKMIYTFETTSPYDFLSSKYQGKPTMRDKKILEYLLVDIGLNPGVVNVLIDFVLKTNNQKLTKVYIDTIAGQWSRLGIKTVEQAMEVASSEHKKQKTRKINSKSETVPEWFDKKIEKTATTEEDIKEMQELLKDYR